MMDGFPVITVSVRPEDTYPNMGLIQLEVKLPYESPYYLVKRISNKELLTCSCLELLFNHATEEVIKYIKQQKEAL